MYRKIYITNITYNIPLLVIEVQRFYVEACNLIFFVTTRQHQGLSQNNSGYEDDFGRIWGQRLWNEARTERPANILYYFVVRPQLFIKHTNR
jgi:hypothetical protein